MSGQSADEAEEYMRNDIKQVKLRSSDMTLYVKDSEITQGVILINLDIINFVGEVNLPLAIFILFL